jgi:hypothetical protein
MPPIILWQTTCIESFLPIHWTLLFDEIIRSIKMRVVRAHTTWLSIEEKGILYKADQNIKHPLKIQA